MRVVFMGTPEFAVPTLSEILGQGHEVACVYTQPPRSAGRGMGERKSPVHAFAETAGLAVETPPSLKSAEAQARFAEFKADVAVVVAYGLILPQNVLDAPDLGCLNLHASLLPRWRGAAPIERAVMADDRETGVSVMRMEAGLDTGPVCMVEKVAIGPDMTAGELHDLLARRGADLMIRALAALSRGALDCQPQPGEGVTYAAKIDKSETRIDWSRPAAEVHNHIRGLSPHPGAWFEAGTGGKAERVKVLRSTLAEATGAPGTVLDDRLTVACGRGAVRLVELQRAGRKPMPAEEFLRGAAIVPKQAQL
ncbi:MAG: methionyl-tRNA formyltransferase [Hyphomicrobiales bacterium]|nr:methionyl-tRNA formyltransferase [Hyphomicrobiales bacterium]